LLNGDSETGVTIIKMNENMDEGDILHQKKMFIYPQDTLGTLSQRLSVMAAEECVFLIKNYFANQHIKAVPQDHSLATYTKKISKNDLFIESFSNQWAVHCKIRAFSPKPGAYIRHNNKRIKLILSEFTNNQLILHQVQPEGKAIMSYSDYLLGNPLGFFYDH
jgi:methionyl-tRNA formyltransferase